MRHFIRISAIIAIFAVSACSTSNMTQKTALSSGINDQIEKSKIKVTSRILILSPQCVDPNKDTVGFNSLVERVTQAFSSKIQTNISLSGRTPINILDQNFRYTNGEKLALHSIKSNADAAIVLTIESPQVNGEYSTNLRVQYFDLVLQEHNENKIPQSQPMKFLNRIICGALKVTPN